MHSHTHTHTTCSTGKDTSLSKNSSIFEIGELDDDNDDDNDSDNDIDNDSDRIYNQLNTNGDEVEAASTIY